ncbi:hypothetical protein RGQ21_22380 [Kitasatospora aureofaciens]|nr:hypothetical protein RGQ21_22380 [Kitasatospora aureofaciens]
MAGAFFAGAFFAAAFLAGPFAGAAAFFAVCFLAAEGREAMGVRLPGETAVDTCAYRFTRSCRPRTGTELTLPLLPLTSPHGAPDRDAARTSTRTGPVGRGGTRGARGVS